ncbi:MAG: PD-(D/E)XK nuclease family protein [Sedimentisphaerales bacterium]|nr:PD-(D/E)XK nuclease family protein [Sedimentisphaerales bacterium]
MSTAEKPHISATQYTMWARCPEQYRRRYICGEVIPPGIALLQGSAFHVGAETNMRQKIESHEDLPAPEIVEAAAAGFEERVAGGYVLSDEESACGAKLVLGQAKDQLVALMWCHAAEQAPDYQPVAVEHTTRILFPHATHDMLAITDLRDDRGRVVDFKTAARKPPQADADTSVQLTIYAAAYQIETGQPPSEVRLDVVTKTKTPKRHVLPSHRDRNDYAALLSRINTMLAAIAALSGHGIEPWPAAPVGAWWCCDKFCGFWRTCPHVNSERKEAAKE